MKERRTRKRPAIGRSQARRSLRLAFSPGAVPLRQSLGGDEYATRYYAHVRDLAAMAAEIETLRES